MYLPRGTLLVQDRKVLKDTRDNITFRSILIFSFFQSMDRWRSSRHITHQYKAWLTLRLGQQVPRPFIGHLSDTRGRLTGLALHVPPTPNRLSRL